MHRDIVSGGCGECLTPKNKENVRFWNNSQQGGTCYWENMGQLVEKFIGLMMISPTSLYVKRSPRLNIVWNDVT